MKRGILVALALVCASACVPASAVAAPPANDDFADREVLAGALPIEVTRSNVEATKEEGEGIPGLSPAGHSIWFEWEAPSTEMVTIGSCDSDFPTVLAIFTGTELDSLVPRVSGNADEGPGCLYSQQRYSFKATAGVKYVIAVDGNNYTGPEPVPVETEGNVVLRIESTPPPANDDFADATTVSGQIAEEPGGDRFYFASAQGYNWNATTETGEPEDEDLSGASVWYAWTAPEDAKYRIGQPCCGTGLSRTVYVGDALGSLSPLLGPGSSEVTLSAGTTVRIRIGGIPGADTKEPGTGSFQFFVSASLPPKPPVPVVIPPPEDALAPSTSIAKRKIKPRKGTAKFWFASDDAGATFRCRLDTRKFVPCGVVKIYKNLKPGRHVLKTQAVDAAGNVDSTPAVARFQIAAPQHRPGSR
jgi:hypothetical protein